MTLQAPPCLCGVPNELCCLVFSFVIDDAQEAAQIFDLALVNHAWEACLLVATRGYLKETRDALRKNKSRCDQLKLVGHDRRVEAIMRIGGRLGMSRAELINSLDDADSHINLRISPLGDHQLERAIADLRDYSRLCAGEPDEWLLFAVRTCEDQGAKYRWLENVVRRLGRRPLLREAAQLEWANAVQRRIQSTLRRQEEGLEVSYTRISNASAWMTVDELLSDADSADFDSGLDDEMIEDV